MRLFSGKKISEDLVRAAKSHISREYLGTHGITAVGTRYHEQEDQRFVYVGTQEASQIADVSRFIQGLKDKGEIVDVPVEIGHSGLAVALKK